MRSVCLPRELELHRWFCSGFFFFFPLDDDAAKREFKKYQDRNKSRSLRETRHPVGFSRTGFLVCDLFFPESD